MFLVAWADVEVRYGSLLTEFTALLLTAHRPLLTAHCPMITVHCSQLTAHCSLVTAQVHTEQLLRSAFIGVQPPGGIITFQAFADLTHSIPGGER